MCNTTLKQRTSHFSKRLINLIIPVVLGIAIAQTAMAGSNSANFAVTANVSNNCTISATPIAFGAYDPVSGSAVNGSGTVTVTCTKNAAPTIGLGNGNNYTTTRNMLGQTSKDNLGYALYQPPDTSVGTACGTGFTSDAAWTTTGTGLFSPGAAPDNTGRTYNICGQIPANQNVGADTNYSDTVSATVNF